MGAHQIGLSFVVLLLLVLQIPELFPTPQARQALLRAGVLAAALAAVWLLVALASGYGPTTAAAGLFGRSLGRFLRHLALWPPAITLPALAGAAAILVRSWRGRAGEGERYLLLVVLGVIAGRALFARKWEVRYLSDLWPLWELLAGWSLVTLAAFLTRRAPLARMRGAAAAVGLSLLLLVGLLPGTGPHGTLAYLRRGAGSPPPAARPVTGFATDLRGASAWVRERLEPGELVVATDWLTTYCYLGRVDGWLRATGYGRQSFLDEGEPRDAYLGARVLPDLEALRSWSASRPVWIVAGGREWGNREKLHPEVQAWLETREPLFQARDGRTRVFRIDRGEW